MLTNFDTVGTTHPCGSNSISKNAAYTSFAKRILEISGELMSSPSGKNGNTFDRQVNSETEEWRPPTARDFQLALRIRATRRRANTGQFLQWPAWDMLLDLAAMQAEKVSISVSAVCVSSGAPQTTALRKLADLEAGGLVQRRTDDRDRRKISVELTAAGAQFVVDRLKESAAFFRQIGSRS